MLSPAGHGMTSDLEQLQTWCDLKCGVPPVNVTNELLIELIGWHLHPVIVKELLKKSTPVQLVVTGYVRCTLSCNSFEAA